MKGVNVLFAHDTELALQAAAALVNTDADPFGGVDDLATLAALEDFVREWGWTGSRRRSRAELDEVRALRPALRRLWELGEDELVRHGEWPSHLHATPAHAPLADRMAVEAAMAFVDVVRQGELDRLRVCEAADCRDVLVDLSKNRSRRYCST